MSSPKKVLLVVTSASALGGTPTGIWLAELAEPWYAFKAAGYEITLGSTAGGACSIGKGTRADCVHVSVFIQVSYFRDYWLFRSFHACGILELNFASPSSLLRKRGLILFMFVFIQLLFIAAIGVFVCFMYAAYLNSTLLLPFLFLFLPLPASPTLELNFASPFSPSPGLSHRPRIYGRGRYGRRREEVHDRPRSCRCSRAHGQARRSYHDRL